MCGVHYEGIFFGFLILGDLIEELFGIILIMGYGSVKVRELRKGLLGIQ